METLGRAATGMHRFDVVVQKTGGMVKFRLRLKPHNFATAAPMSAGAASVQRESAEP